MIAKRLEWGWTSYRRTGWINKNGQRCYTVNLSASSGQVGEFETVRLLFWARRPILAIREMAATGLPGDRLLARFDGQVVN